MKNKKSLSHPSELVELLPGVVFECEIDGTVTYVNNQAFEKFGYTRADFNRGVNSAQMLISKDSTRLKKNIALLIKGEKSSGNEYTALRKDGTKFPVVIYSAVIYKDKIPQGFRGIIIDISARKQAEERFRLAAEVASDLIYEWDVLTDSLQWFGDIDKALGLKPGEFPMTINAWTERIHPEDQIRLKDAVELHRKSRKKIYEEYRIKKNDGTWLYWIDRGVPILDEKKKPVKWIGVCIDVTDRRQGEQALRESEDRWRSLTQNSPDHVITLDKDLRISFCNYASPGFTVNDLLGKHLYKFVSPDRQQEIKNIQENVLKTGIPNRYETEYETPDGKIIYYDTRIAPWFLSGDIIGLLLTARDVTAHKQAELDRQRYSDLLKETERIAELGGWEYDVGTKTNFWSEQMYALYGVPLDFDIHDIKKISDFFPLPFGDIILNSFYSAIEKGIPYDHKLKFINARGEELWVRAIGEPILAAGKVIKIRGNFQDISSQKAAEEEIKASLNEKEVLLKEIHHRVKNNMQIISSLLRLQEGLIQNKKDLEIFQESQNRIRSMALIHEKLYQSKDFANIDFGLYVKNFSRHLYVAYQIDPGRIKLTVQVQEVLLDVNLAIPCGLILNELVSNVFKHAFPGKRKGAVKISLLESSTEKITMSVSDDGIGLSPGVNFKNQDTLGFQLVRDLINQIHGSIKLKKEAGTTVIIDFKR